MIKPSARIKPNLTLKNTDGLGAWGKGCTINIFDPLIKYPSTNQKTDLGSLNKKRSALLRPSLA
jgi:hypothetical protein